MKNVFGEPCFELLFIAFSSYRLSGAGAKCSCWIWAGEEFWCWSEANVKLLERSLERISASDTLSFSADDERAIKNESRSFLEWKLRVRRASVHIGPLFSQSGVWPWSSVWLTSTVVGGGVFRLFAGALLGLGGSPAALLCPFFFFGGDVVRCLSAHQAHFRARWAPPATYGMTSLTPAPWPSDENARNLHAHDFLKHVWSLRVAILVVFSPFEDDHCIESARLYFILM
jgi:hypothetical protein